MGLQHWGLWLEDNSNPGESAVLSPLVLHGWAQRLYPLTLWLCIHGQEGAGTGPLTGLCHLFLPLDLPFMMPNSWTTRLALSGDLGLPSVFRGFTVSS